MNAQDPSEAGPPLRSVPGRRRWPMIVLMIVVFAAGIAIGAGGTVVYFDQTSRYYRAHPELFPQRMAERLRGRLGLSRQQARQVREIIARRWPAMQEARRQAYPLVKPELDRMHQEIAAVLNDRQRQRWDEYFNSLQRMINPDKPAATQPATPSQPEQAP